MTALAPSKMATLAISDATLAETIAPFLGWFHTIRGRSRNTILAYEADLYAFSAFAASVGVTSPRQVTFNTVEMFMAHRLHREGKQASTLNRARYAIAALFKFLRRQGLTEGNPVEDVYSLKEPKRLPRYLTIAEQERMLAHFATERSLLGLRDYAIIATGLLCGLRVSELATVKVTDVDLEAGRLRVVGKGNKEREGVVTPRLRKILQHYLDDVRPRLVSLAVAGRLYRKKDSANWYMAWVLGGKAFRQTTGTSDKAEAEAILADHVADLRREQHGPYLFPRAHPKGSSHAQRRRGQPLLTRSIFMMVNRKVSAVVGRPVGPHQLRHSFASRLRENGAPLELVKDAMGHENISTTLIYAHISTKKQREDVAKYLEGGTDSDGRRSDGQGN